MRAPLTRRIRDGSVRGTTSDVLAATQDLAPTRGAGGQPDGVCSDVCSPSHVRLLLQAPPQPPSPSDPQTPERTRSGGTGSYPSAWTSTHDSRSASSRSVGSRAASQCRQRRTREPSSVRSVQGSTFRAHARQVTMAKGIVAELGVCSCITAKG